MARWWPRGMNLLFLIILIVGGLIALIVTIALVSRSGGSTELNVVTMAFCVSQGESSSSQYSRLRFKRQTSSQCNLEKYKDISRSTINQIDDEGKDDIVIQFLLYDSSAWLHQAGTTYTPKDAVKQLDNIKTGSKSDVNQLEAFKLFDNLQKNIDKNGFTYFAPCKPEPNLDELKQYLSKKDSFGNTQSRVIVSFNMTQASMKNIYSTLSNTTIGIEAANEDPNQIAKNITNTILTGANETITTTTSLPPNTTMSSSSSSISTVPSSSTSPGKTTTTGTAPSKSPSSTSNLSTTQLTSSGQTSNPTTPSSSNPTETSATKSQSSSSSNQSTPPQTSTLSPSSSTQPPIVSSSSQQPASTSLPHSTSNVPTTSIVSNSQSPSTKPHTSTSQAPVSSSSTKQTSAVSSTPAQSSVQSTSGMPQTSVSSSIPTSGSSGSTQTSISSSSPQTSSQSSVSSQATTQRTSGSSGSTISGASTSTTGQSQSTTSVTGSQTSTQTPTSSSVNSQTTTAFTGSSTSGQSQTTGSSGSTTPNTATSTIGGSTSMGSSTTSTPFTGSSSTQGTTTTGPSTTSGSTPISTTAFTGSSTSGQSQTTGSSGSTTPNTATSTIGGSTSMGSSTTSTLFTGSSSTQGTTTTGPKLNINCYFVGDANSFGDPTKNDSIKDAYNNEREFIGKVAKYFYDNENFGANVDFFGYSFNQFAPKSDTVTVMTYDDFYNNYLELINWDLPIQATSGDVKSAIDSINSDFGWKGQLPAESSCIVFFSGQSDLTGVPKINNSHFDQQIGVGLSDTDFTSVIANSVPVTSSLNDTDLNAVVNAILTAFQSTPAPT